MNVLSLFTGIGLHDLGLQREPPARPRTDRTLDSPAGKQSHMTKHTEQIREQLREVERGICDMVAIALRFSPYGSVLDLKDMIDRRDELSRQLAHLVG